MAKRYHMMLVSHTHADREWSHPFQQFRIRLVRAGDLALQILESDPRFASWTWDGQTAAVMDYLEIRPEHLGRIQRLVREGRLWVGPWYVQPDEFLVSGEALVRNLMLGHRQAIALGRVMPVGYLPDSFGHTAQMPAILRGFGLDSAIFQRGLGDELEQMNTEFWWEALDGSEVLAIYQVHSYANAAGWGTVSAPGEGPAINYEAAVEAARRELAGLARYASTSWLLLNNGADCVEPQPDIPDVITFVNAHLEGADVVQGDFPQYVAKVRSELPEVGRLVGELHSSRYLQVLPGIYSSRMYLKQENARAECALLQWAEPLSALAAQHGRRHDRALLWKSWEILLQNHAHDSIGGCSADPVHREMRIRTASSQQIAETLSHECMAFLAGRIDTGFAREAERAVVLFNTLGRDYDGLVTVRLELPIMLADLPRPFVVTDPDGVSRPAQTISDRVTEYYYPHPSDRRVREVEIVFPAQVPAVGWAAYALTEAAERPGAESALVVGQRTMENEFLQVTMNDDGSCDVLHKETGSLYRAGNHFESDEDCGDEYNWSPAQVSLTVTTLGGTAALSLVEAGPWRATFRADLEWSLPEGLAPDRLSRSDKRVPCPLTTYVTLHHDSPRLEMRTVFDNRARDHRLRAVFPTDLEARFSYADTAFGVVERPVGVPPAVGWVEKPVAQHPMRAFVDANDGLRGAAVISEGLPEYELRTDPEGAALCLTLLRAVGWLSRDDAPARPYNVGVKMATPEAQCLGWHEFRYAFFPHNGTWEQAHAWDQAARFLAPPQALPGPGRSGPAPGRFSLLRVEPAGLVLSTLKLAEQEDLLVVRVYNTTNEELEGRLAFAAPVVQARFANLNEEPLGEEPSVEGNVVLLQPRPFQILTLLVTLGG